MLAMIGLARVATVHTAPTAMMPAPISRTSVVHTASAALSGASPATG